MRSRSRPALPVLLALLLPPAAAADADPESLWQEIRATRLAPERAVEVSGLRLDTGMAELSIERGVFFPATAVGERVVEMVFLGRARLHLEPPDDIEAGQLELFTGHPRLDEEITEAVLAIAHDAASERIYGRDPVAAVDPADRARAEELFRRWRSRPERRLLGVDTALLRDAWGDPFYQSYFAGWFQSEALGDFLYLFSPDEREQVTLGRFTPLDASDKEKRKLSRALHRSQRRGRLRGMTLDDLGVWDTWLSASRLAADGSKTPGGRAFEPRHYDLDLSLEGSELSLDGHSRLHLKALSDVVRVVQLELHSDLAVERVADAAGTELPFRQAGRQVLVFLDAAPRAGDEIILAVDYSGRLIDKISRSYTLRDTVNWYPHAGSLDLATYEATFRWPAKLDLVAGGERVEGGDAEGRRFSRHRLNHPTGGFSFEVGKFRTLTGTAGDVEINLVVDPFVQELLDRDARAELLTDVSGALVYLEQVFGPYPLDRLTVVTSARSFSQGLLSFVTLSAVAVGDSDLLSLLFGLQDRRTLIAHELAHQWWGHVVAWPSYRDQWISEAMANYAAVLYARHRLADDRPVIGPTSGWQDALTSTLDDGRPVESSGPLVLGERLHSSRSEGAYRAIVYKKGALVLDMLARNFGEARFLEILRTVVETVGFRALSTEIFLELVERVSGRQLDGFAQQFIYGTGLIEVYYTYDFERLATGKWSVKGTARQQAPYRYHYRVVAKDNGTFDVARRRLDQITVAGSALTVPLQIAAYDPAAESGRRRKRGEPDPAEVGNTRFRAHMLLEGPSTEFAFEIDYQPKALWLDRDSNVFGRFWNQRRFPKQMLYYQGLDEAGAGRHGEAEELFRQALAAEVVAGPSYQRQLSERDLRAIGRGLDAAAQLELARLHLDRDRLADAAAAFAAARQLATAAGRDSGDFKTVEARLLVRRGESERAFKLLHKAISRRGELDSVEGLLLLVIAAHQTGRSQELEPLLATAGERGADVAALAGGGAL